MRSEHTKALVALALALFAALSLPGCGGSDGPDVNGPGTLVGRLLTTSGKSTLASTPIEVSVLEQSGNRTAVGSDGRFALQGLPAGRFTLILRQGDTPLGTLAFEDVAPEQALTILVDLDLTLAVPEAVLVLEDRRGIGAAAVELEWMVENVVTVDPKRDSTFVIAGRTVIARAGATTIRQGIALKPVGEVLPGMRVHLTGASTGTDVLAHRIRILGDGESDGGAAMKACHLRDGSAARTLDIDSTAWPSHEAHGDRAGAC
jgi:hypothetical protein